MYAFFRLGLALAFVAFAVPAAFSQTTALDGVKREYTSAKTAVLKAANKTPEDILGFRPSPDVFTLRRMYLHIAGAAYSICSGAAGKPGTAPKVDVEAAATKAQVLEHLNSAFSYCDDVFAASKDSTLAETFTANGRTMVKSYYFSHLIGHTNLHYGNVVTYLRINGIAPGD